MRIDQHYIDNHANSQGTADTYSCSSGQVHQAFLQF